MAQIYCAQDTGDFLWIVGFFFLEDQHFGMVVNSESFLCKLVVDYQISYGRIRFKNLNQLETQVTFEHARFGDVVAPNDVFIDRAAQQVAIVGNRQWISLGEAGSRRPLAVRRYKDVIRLIERGREAS